MVPLRYSIFLPLLLPSSFPSFFTLYLPPPPFSLPPSSPQPSGAKTTCHAYSMKQSAQRPLRIATAWQGRDVAQSTPLKVLYQCAGVNNNESKSMERLFPLAVEYHLGTFAEKYSTWDFYERNSTKTQETNCPLNPKYGVIFCVRVKLQGGLCRKYVDSAMNAGECEEDSSHSELRDRTVRTIEASVGRMSGSVERMSGTQ